MSKVFSEEQNKMLEGKLSPLAVKSRKQSGFDLSYVEGWYVKEIANKIFGFDGWNMSVIDMVENHDPILGKDKKGNQQYAVSFRAKVRVNVGGVIREDYGYGSGFSGKVSDAYESATKEAVTDAFKRAMSGFGNKFGLALYDKQKRGVGVNEPVKPPKEKLEPNPTPPKEKLEQKPVAQISEDDLNGLADAIVYGASICSDLKQFEEFKPTIMADMGILRDGNNALFVSVGKQVAEYKAGLK